MSHHPAARAPDLPRRLPRRVAPLSLWFVALLLALPLLALPTWPLLRATPPDSARRSAAPAPLLLAAAGSLPLLGEVAAADAEIVCLANGFLIQGLSPLYPDAQLRFVGDGPATSVGSGAALLELRLGAAASGALLAESGEVHYGPEGGRFVALLGDDLGRSVTLAGRFSCPERSGS